MSQDRENQAVGPKPDDPPLPDGTTLPEASSPATGKLSAWRAQHPLLSTFVLLLVPALLVYLVVTLLQAAYSAPQVVLLKTEPVTAGGVTYQIVYPEKLVRDGPLVEGQELSVWVSGQAKPGLVVSPTLQVALNPVGKGIRFVDQEEHQIPPTLRISSVNPAQAGGAIGLRYSEQVDAADQVALTAQLIDGEGQAIPHSWTTPFNITRENSSQAFWRRLGESLLSPSTPLLSAAASLLAVAFGQYLEEEKERRKEARKTRQRRERGARLSEIDRIAQLIPHRMEEAVRAYHELRDRWEVDPEWKGDAELTGHLNQIWEQLQKHDWEGVLLRQAVRLIAADKAGEAGSTLRWLEESEKNTEQVASLEIIGQLAQAQENEESLRPVVQDHGIDRVLEALNWASREQTRHLGPLAERLVFGLAAEKGYSELIENQIKSGELEARLLVRGTWPQLWPAPPPPARDEVQRWLKARKLAFHPFASEDAEKDYRLPWYAVEEPLMKVQGAFSSLFFAPEGCGKTAAALLLGYHCGNPRHAPGDPGSFPVFYRLQLARPRQVKVPPSLVGLARATAREILTLLSYRPSTWRDLPPYRQRALVDFVRYAYRGARSLLDADLASLPASLLPHFSSRLPGGKVRLDTQTWIEMCAAALPAGFDRFLWLVDVPGRWGKQLFEPTQGALNDLLACANHLASVGIFLKLFVPIEFHHRLQRPAGLTETTFWWEEETLQKMLDERMKQVGKESLLELCDGRSVNQGHLDQMIERAAGSPRRLVRLGAALIQSAASAPKQTKILRKDFENAQSKLGTGR